MLTCSQRAKCSNGFGTRAMIWFDCETFNDVPINHGTYKYAESCEGMIVTYAIDNGPVAACDITAGDTLPDDLAYMLDDPDEPICAHFAMFDRNVLRLARNMRQWLQGREIPIHRWRCSMTKAYAHSLPGSLDKLCTVLKVPYDLAKQKDGKRLIHLFCKPRGDNVKIKRATRETHPAEWQKFIDYAVSDVEAMRFVYNKLPNWNYEGKELDLWHLDQRINDRGITVDVEFANAAIRATDRAQRLLKKQVQETTSYDEATGEGVESATQRDALLAYILEEHGVDLPDMQKATLERREQDTSLPDEVRELIRIRLAASTSSTTKYKALIRGVQDDNRLRGTLQFCGAMRTGRWGGRQFQPHNMPRPDMTKTAIALAIDAVLVDALDLVHPEPMRALANSIRGCVVAPPGKKLVIADLKNIEGCSAAWLADEQWKVDAFHAVFKNPALPDLYKLAYARAFNISPDFDETTVEGYFMRQIGKVLELFMQYEGGVGAFITGAATYGIDLDKMATLARPSIPADVWAEAVNFYDWSIESKRSTFGLSQLVFCVCDSLKRMWRRKHPCIVAYWKDLKEMAVVAVNNPGVWHDCGKVKFRRDGAWLRMKLPSGRYLCYPSPQVNAKGELSYMGVSQYTRQWCRIKTYGGKLFENLCQAFARDVLAYQMPEIDAAGYEIVLTVHDEDGTETPDTPDYTVDRLVAMMTKELAWAPGLPLAASGFETYRYRKD